MSRQKLNTLCGVLSLIAACATNPKPQVETPVSPEVISRCEKVAATIREKIGLVEKMERRLRSEGLPACRELRLDPNLGSGTLFEWLHPHGDDAAICVGYDIPIITDTDYAAHAAMHELSETFKEYCADLDQK